MTPPKLDEMCYRAKQASYMLSRASTLKKNQAIKMLAQLLEEQKSAIYTANERDIALAHEKKLSEAMIDRLTLRGRLEAITEDLHHIVSLPDPIGEIFDEKVLPNGLKLHKQRVPIGVLGVIYESRPNVTIDVASLSLKTGNAVILRGGSETLNTNRQLVSLIQEALLKSDLSPHGVLFIDHTGREWIFEMLKMHQFIDLIIPRGGAALHQLCREHSTIPVITGGMGVCHLFVSASANLDRSLEVIANAKLQRPAACNALDTVLIHRSVARALLPLLINRLSSNGVSFRYDENIIPYLTKEELQLGKAAVIEDWDTEWVSLILGLKIIDTIDEAITHISTHSQGHSDGILTEDKEEARKFIQEVDSAAVYVNASTRFTDGGQFGLGAEVAISTQKIHARGPLGLKELTSYKWVGTGNYHIRK